MWKGEIPLVHFLLAIANEDTYWTMLEHLYLDVTDMYKDIWDISGFGFGVFPAAKPESPPWLAEILLPSIAVVPESVHWLGEFG